MFWRYVGSLGFQVSVSYKQAPLHSNNNGIGVCAYFAFLFSATVCLEEGCILCQTSGTSCVVCAGVCSLGKRKTEISVRQILQKSLFSALTVAELGVYPHNIHNGFHTIVSTPIGSLGLTTLEVPSAPFAVPFSIDSIA